MDVVLLGLALPGVENHAIGSLRAALRSARLEEAFVPFTGFTHLATVIQQVLALRPRVVGVSLQTIESALATVVFTRTLRERGFRGRIAIGGHFATLNAEDLLRADAGIDAVVRFAGEEALLAIANGALDDANRRATVPGLVFIDQEGEIRRGAPPRWTSPSVLSRAARFEPLPEHLGFVAADLVASRGCEAHCAYCCIAAASDIARREASSSGERLPYERRPLESLAEEMASLHDEHGARVFNFMDDNVLPLDPNEAADWARELKGKLDARGVPPVALSIQLRADAVTERSAEALARLGLARAYVGVDGYSPSQLRALGRRADASCGHRAVELLWQQGVFSVVNALLVGPTIPFRSVELEIEGLSRIEHAPVHLLPIEVRAGTSYFRAAMQRGLVEGGFLYWHYRFADERTEKMAEILTSFPTRLAERSVPIALYDLGYNVGIARRLIPEIDVTRHSATFARISSEWNRDQLDVLRKAAVVVSTNDRKAALDFVAREMDRIGALDRALRDSSDRALVDLESLVSRFCRRRVAAHSRGKLLGTVAFSMSLAACGGTVERSGKNPLNSATDASLSSNGTGGDTGGLILPGSGGSVAELPAPDAAQCFDDPSRTVGSTKPHGDGYEVNANYCGNSFVTFDDQGRAVAFQLEDGGVPDPNVVECFKNALAQHCYPSLAGTTTHLFSAHHWIA